MLSGMDKFVKPVQYSKHLSSSFLTLPGNLIFESFEQPEKAQYLIVVTVFGIVILVILEQS